MPLPKHRGRRNNRYGVRNLLLKESKQNVLYPGRATSTLNESRCCLHMLIYGHALNSTRRGRLARNARDLV